MEDLAARQVQGHIVRLNGPAWRWLHACNYTLAPKSRARAHLGAQGRRRADVGIGYGAAVLEV